MNASQSAIAKTRGQQTITAIDAAIGPGFVAKVDQKLYGPRHIGLHRAEVRPVLGQLGLPDHREHGDPTILPVLTATTGEDASTILLALPRRFQSLLCGSVIAEVAGGLQKEVAVNNPQ